MAMGQADLDRTCWILAGIAGVLVLLFSAGIGSTSMLGGLFLGAIATWFIGATLGWLLRRVPADATLPGPVVGTTPEEWQATQRAAPAPAPAAPRPAQSGPRLPIVAGTLPAGWAEEPAPGADDLQRIKGVGPKISDWLRDNGITSFAQIAAWDAGAVADVAQRLGRLGGRIEAEDWVGQAQLLAAGGETAHSRRHDGGGAG